jgi:hypothetical protein
VTDYCFLLQPERMPQQIIIILFIKMKLQSKQELAVTILLLNTKQLK